MTLLLILTLLFHDEPPSVRSFIAYQGTYPVTEHKMMRGVYESYCRTVLDLPIEGGYRHLVCVQTLVAEGK